MRTYYLNGIFLKMIDYPSKVCNTSAMGTFFIVTFSDNWVQKDAKNDIEAYNITYTQTRLSKPFLHLLTYWISISFAFL